MAKRQCDQFETNFHRKRAKLSLDNLIDKMFVKNITYSTDSNTSNFHTNPIDLIKENQQNYLSYFVKAVEYEKESIELHQHLLHQYTIQLRCLKETEISDFNLNFFDFKFQI